MNLKIQNISKNKILPFIIVLCLSCLFVGALYKDVIFSPNRYLFNNKGDAIKNYFTYATQIDQDSYTQTNIMNYPYGESFLYLDCQPGLTMILHPLSKVFPSISSYSVGIINFMMLFSIVITSLFVYLILCEFGINRFYASFCGFAIGVLAPQIMRITGHLALSYSFVIPVAWYLFIRFYKSDTSKLKWSAILGIVLLFFFLLHGYLGMIAVLLILFCYIFYYFFYLRKKPFDKKHLLYFSLQIIIPLLIYYLFVSATDHHEGRTDNPWGYMATKANLKTVFLPTNVPLKPLLEKIFSFKGQTWEGWSYVGFFSVIILVYCLVRFIRNRKFLKGFWELNPILKISFFAGICILLVSMAYPFKLGLQFLLDWFPSIKNFRAIGRFAWGFYYVATVFSVSFLYYVYKNSKYKKAMLVILLLLPVSYYTEGIPHHKSMIREFPNVENAFKRGSPQGNYAKALNSINIDEYQSIIPLPFYHFASENYDKPASDKIYMSSMTFSYHSSIPLMSCYSTRVSIPESKSALEILSPAFYPKSILKDIHDERPFLILYSHEDLSLAEKEILSKSEEVFSSDEFSLYKIEKNTLFENTANKEIEDFLRLRNSLIQQNGFMCSDSNIVIAYNSFDSISSQVKYRGTGALEIKKKGYHTLHEIEPNVFEEGQEYIVCFWISNEWKNFGQDYLRSNLIVQEVDEEGNVQWISNTDPIHSTIFNDSWTMVELVFRPENVQKRIQILIKGGSKPRKAVYFIDDLLIYKSNTTLYKIMEEDADGITELFKNNHKISLYRR